MAKRFSLLMLALGCCLAMPLTTMGQNTATDCGDGLVRNTYPLDSCPSLLTATIVEGTTYENFNPFRTDNPTLVSRKRGGSWHIYTQSELLNAHVYPGSNILRLDLRSHGATTMYKVQIYLLETDHGPIGSVIDTIPTSQMTLVGWADTLTITQGWNEIPLQVGYQYSGQGNLAVAFRRDSAFTTTCEFYKDEQGYYISYYASGQPNTYPTMGRISGHSALRLGFCPPASACLSPDSLQAFTTDTTMAISWNGSASQYQVMVGSDGFNPDLATAATARIITTAASQITLNGLTSGTIYDVYVRSLCGNDTSLWTSLTHVKTLCDPLPLPQSLSLDIDDVDSCWHLYDAQLLPNSITFTNLSHLGPVVLPPFDAPISRLHLSFAIQFRYSVNAIFGVVTNPYNPASFIPVDTLLVVKTGGPNILQTNYAECDMRNYSGPEGRLAVRFSGGPSASNIDISNFTVDTLQPCYWPHRIVVDSVNGREAFLSWQHRINSPVGYEVECISSTGTLRQTVAADSCHLTGLQPNTAYQVRLRSICAVGDTSAWSLPAEASFVTDTACPPVRNLHADSLWSSGMQVSWQGVGAPVQYAVHCIVPGLGTIDTAVSVTQITLNNLPYLTTCTISVRAINSAGDTSVAQTITPRTLLDRRHRPTQVQIGQTNQTYTGFVPINRYDNHTWTESLYMRDSIGIAGRIDTLWLYTDISSSSTYDSIVDIYLAHTTTASISGSNWTPASQLTLVKHAGNLVPYYSHTWTAIPLDTPFEYNGINNLTLVVSRHGTTGSVIFGAFEATGRAMYTGSSTSWSGGQHPGNTASTASPRCAILRLSILEQLPPPPTYDAAAASHQDNLGTAQITAVGDTAAPVQQGTYEEGTVLQYEAIPAAIGNYSCRFVRWNDGDTANPRLVTLTQDTLLTAYFALPQFTVSATAEPAHMGTVSGSGTYSYGDTVTLTAATTNDTRYEFLGWSDSEMPAQRSVAVTADTSLVAQFGFLPASCIISVSNPARGTTDPEPGQYPISVGETLYLNALPEDGFIFDYWKLTLLGAIDTSYEASLAYPIDTLLAGSTCSFICRFAIDTVESITPAEQAPLLIYSLGSNIVVRGAEGEPVRIYDMMGRLTARCEQAADEQRFTILQPGIYLVQIGSRTAKKALIVK